jgi:hypothetical protein
MSDYQGWIEHDLRKPTWLSPSLRGLVRHESLSNVLDSIYSNQGESSVLHEDYVPVRD